MSRESTGFQLVGRQDSGELLDDLTARAAAEAEMSCRLRKSSLETLGSELERAARAIAQRLIAGGFIYTFGNGAGSSSAACVAALFSRSPGGIALPARCLVDDQAVLTAIGNNLGYELTFSRQLATFARAGDVTMGYSTGPNADNVIRAFEEAARRGILTVGFAGRADGPMAACGVIDHCFAVPSHSVHRIEEAQAALSCRLWAMVQQELRPEGKRRVAWPQQPAARQELLEPEEAL
jgi:D-sedoheptulose 7-phosphate isomerase